MKYYVRSLSVDYEVGSGPTKTRNHTVLHIFNGLPSPQHMSWILLSLWKFIELALTHLARGSIYSLKMLNASIQDMLFFKTTVNENEGKFVLCLILHCDMKQGSETGHGHRAAVYTHGFAQEVWIPVEWDSFIDINSMYHVVTDKSNGLRNWIIFELRAHSRRNFGSECFYFL